MSEEDARALLEMAKRDKTPTPPVDQTRFARKYLAVVEKRERGERK